MEQIMSKRRFLGALTEDERGRRVSRWKHRGGELPAGHNTSSDLSLRLSTHRCLSKDSCKEATTLLSSNHLHLWQMLWNEKLEIEHISGTIYRLCRQHGPWNNGHVRKNSLHCGDYESTNREKINPVWMKIDLLEARSGTGRWCCWEGCSAGSRWWSRPRSLESLWFADGEPPLTRATGSCQWCFPQWWRKRPSGSLASPKPL